MTRASPRRVTYLISDFEGGTANHLTSVVEHLDRSAWDPRIVSTDPSAADAASAKPVVAFEPPGVLHRFPIAQIRELIASHRLLRSHPTEILHCYFFWPIIYGRILKAAGAVDILVENREDEGFNWSPREYRILRATRSLVDCVVAVSESVRRITIEREELAQDRIEVIHNAIEDVDLPRPERMQALRDRWGLEEGALTVGFVGNYERPVKGLRYLIEAVPQVMQKTSSVQFFVVGRGPDRYRQLAREMGVEEAVHFTGPTDDVDSYYGIFDLSVLPSLSEGLSLTLLESMAHGLPVVATRVGGNPEVVEDGETGLLVPPEKPDDLAAAIIDLLRNADRRRTMGRLGRKRVEGRFLQPVATRRYEDLYDRLSGDPVDE